MEPMRRFNGRDGVAITVWDRVVTLSGLVRRVVHIDADGYARLEGEPSTRYVPHLIKLVEHETYSVDLTTSLSTAYPPITAEVLPEFLACLSTKAKAMPKVKDD